MAGAEAAAATVEGVSAALAEPEAATVAEATNKGVEGEEVVEVGIAVMMIAAGEAAVVVAAAATRVLVAPGVRTVVEAAVAAVTSRVEAGVGLVAGVRGNAALLLRQESSRRSVVEVGGGVVEEGVEEAVAVGGAEVAAGGEGRTSLCPCMPGRWSRSRSRRTVGRLQRTTRRRSS